MSLKSNYVTHVKLCHSRQILSLQSNFGMSIFVSNLILYKLLFILVDKQEVISSNPRIHLLIFHGVNISIIIRLAVRENIIKNLHASDKLKRVTMIDFSFLVVTSLLLSTFN